MTNPLFYGTVAVLDRDAHRNIRLDRSGQYSFARRAHLLPALVEEFLAAAPDLAIAFMAGAKAPSPVFIAGLLPNESLLVGDGGEWLGGYVPAYLRRYPFIIGETADKDGERGSLLCIDDSFTGFNPDEGEHLFDEEGAPSAMTNAAISFAERYWRGALHTDAFCAKLQELSLLRSVTFDVKQPDGQKTVVHGLLTVDEEAFNALEDATFLELRKAGYLAPIYAHLLSLRALEGLSKKLRSEGAAAAA